jgi:transketolase
MEDLVKIAQKVRRETIEMIYQAGSGHPGGSLSAADLLVGLYFGEVMEEEDKFILSAGHVCPAWYAVLGQKSKVKSQKLGNLRELGSPLQGHPYKKFSPFVETSTGSLGQGISVGVGLALAKKLKKEKGIIWVFSSNGEQEEGQVWEAAMWAKKENLNNLCFIIDNNEMQIGGRTEQITALEPLRAKYEACGWQVLEIDGHDFKQIVPACRAAKMVRRIPLAIIARTIRGKGVWFMEDQLRYHACTLTKEEYQRAIKELK